MRFALFVVMSWVFALTAGGVYAGLDILDSETVAVLEVDVDAV